VPLRLQGIRRALEAQETARWAYFIVAVGLFVAIIVIANILISRWNRGRRVQAAWTHLARDMARRHLDRGQQELLRKLVLRETPGRPLDIVERIEVFERAVHRYLGSLGAPERRDESVRRAASLVRGLRDKLGFAQARGRAYYSTRELASGQAVHLAPKGRGGAASVWARVQGGHEDVLSLQHVQPADAELRGHPIEVVFFDGKAAFSFDSTVLEVDSEEATCLLAHSIDVRSAGVREFHRVDVNCPVAFRAAWEGPDVRREGTILDLGAGGLALLCPCYYEDGEEILLQLQPDAYLRAPDGPARSHLADRQLKGAILQTRRTADGRCVHHIEFRDVDNEDREYLFRLVRHIELDAGG